MRLSTWGRIAQLGPCHKDHLAWNDSNGMRSILNCLLQCRISLPGVLEECLCYYDQSGEDLGCNHWIWGWMVLSVGYARQVKWFTIQQIVDECLWPCNSLLQPAWHLSFGRPSSVVAADAIRNSNFNVKCVNFQSMSEIHIPIFHIKNHIPSH